MGHTLSHGFRRSGASRSVDLERNDWTVSTLSDSTSDGTRHECDWAARRIRTAVLLGRRLFWLPGRPSFLDGGFFSFPGARLGSTAFFLLPDGPSSFDGRRPGILSLGLSSGSAVLLPKRPSWLARARLGSGLLVLAPDRAVTPAAAEEPGSVSYGCRGGPCSCRPSVSC